MKSSKNDLRVRQRATLDEYRPAALAKSIETRKGKPGKPLTAEHKASIKAANLERESGSDIPFWQIAKHALLGLPSTESAIELNRLQSRVNIIRRDYGFSGWPGAYLHGEVLTRRHVQQFCEDTGLFEKDAAAFIGFGYRSFTNLIGSQPDRPLSSRHPKDKKSPHVGRRLALAYRRVARFCCYHQDRRVLRHGRIRDFLVSEIRDIPAKHAALRIAFGALGTALGEIHSDPETILNWTCKQARLEGSGATDRPFRLLVFLGIQFEHLLKDKPEWFKADRFNARELASALLARDYGAAPGRIDAVIEGELQPLDPRSLSRIVAMIPTVKSQETPNQKLKKRKKISVRTIEKGQFCDQVECEMRQIKNLSRSGRTIVEAQRNYPEFIVWKVRDALSQEDRDSFNSPRQWGPVIGYAEMILGKHYGKNEQTVRGWVKDYRASRKQS